MKFRILCVFLICLSPVVAAAQIPNPIVLENQQPGTTQWQLSQAANDVSKQIKGYASAVSVNKGSPITFYVTVSPAQAYTIDIYRIGWYQGMGGRLMVHLGPFSGTTQPACPVTDPTTGLAQCGWSPATTFTIPSTWTTGIYLAQLTNSQNYQNYINFVVRDDSSSSALLYQESVNTSQAYNNYPDDNVTGKSLYDYNSFGPNTGLGTKRANKVSFDRPYADIGDGNFLAYDIYGVQWLEASGYDVSYSTDVDTHASGSQLLNHKGFLSSSHNEYWSKPMRTAVEQARDAGVNLGFFGADAVFWQVRLEPSTTNAVPNRVLVGYKDQSIDPVQGPTTTVLWRDPFINLPEQMLVGVMYTAQNKGSFNATPDNYVVTNSSNWVYAGTGFAEGTVVPAVVGYEVDKYFSQYPAPVSNPGTYMLLSHSPVVDISSNRADYANSSIYQAPSGAWVFGAGSVYWGWALSRPGFVQVGIQQTTKNILDRFAGLTTGPPVILSQSPAAGATGVSTGTTVSVTFNRAMASATFTSSTFTLRAAGASSNVPASISVSGATATLTPTSALAAGTTYTATVAGTVTDTNGVALGSTATWTFTTAASAPPVIVSQSPAAGATGVSTGTTVSVTFNRAMASATFTSSTFTLRAAGASSNVPASISVSGATATLTPTSALAAGTTYTATVAGTVTDTNGVALGSTATWTFTTAAAAAITVQVSPNSGSGSSVTFALSATDSGGFANVTQADLFIGPYPGATNSCYFEFDSPNTILLRSDANTSWSSATVGSATVLQNSQCSIRANLVTVSGSGNTITVNVPVTFLINQTTAWGLFGFAADQTISTGWQNSGTWTPTTGGPPVILSQSPAAGAVGVSTGTTVSVTFNRAMASATFTSSTFTLRAAGALSNVAASINVSGATATLTPSSALAAGTTYTATVAGTVTDTNGVALGSMATWNFTTAAGPPVIVSQSPASGATGVSTGTTVSVTFNRAMASATFTSSTFTLLAAGSSTNVAASISVSGATATLTPSSALAAGTTYTATVAGTVTDTNGVALGSTATWNFTTAAAAPPVIVSQSPAAGATGVSTGTTVSVTFNRAMASATFTSSTFTLLAAGSSTNVAASISVSGATATLTPSSALAAGTTYTVTVASTVTDTNGVALGSTATWTFTTAAAAPPVIVSQSPAAGATGVSTGTTVSVTFNRAMASATFTSSTFTLLAAGSSTNVAVSISVSGATATLTPSSALAAGTTYTVTVASTVTDTNGVALGSTATWTFTTAAAAPPVIVSQSPASGATGVSTGTTVSVTFNRAMASATFTSSTFTLRAAGASTNVAASISVSGATATLTPSSALAAGTTYTATVAGTVTDTNGVALGSMATWNFTTAAGPPVIVSQSPASGATGVSTGTTVSVTFNRAMASATFTSSTFTLLAAGASTNVAASISVSGATATLTPTSALAAGTTYTATVASTVTDTNGIALGSTATGTFTTAAAAAISVQVSPNSGSGSSVTFTLSATDSGGYANVIQTDLFIGPYPGATNSCYWEFDLPSTIYLRSDANTSWSSATVGTATVLQNTQCSINANLVTVSGSGNTLTVNVPVTFRISQTTAWGLFGWAADPTIYTGWQNIGTWIP